MENIAYSSLIGGGLIGIAVSIMLVFNGRVTGISGIFNGILNPEKDDTQWRVMFVLGLLLGGFILKSFNKSIIANETSLPDWTLITAGILVGFGTVMGSGCTSGHGVCGISRVSPRSIVATITFILSGVITVFIFNKLGISV